MDYSRRRPVAPRTYKNKENILIPILFIAGAIAWLFFVVDHFVGTSGHYVRSGQVSNIDKRSLQQQEKPWLNNVKAWINTQLDETQNNHQKVAQSTLKDENTSPEEKLDIIEESDMNFANKAQTNDSNKDNEVISSDGTSNGIDLFLYFYKGSSTNLNLEKVSRSIIHQGTKTNYYLAIDSLLQGPTTEERIQKKIIDSFPVKPILLNAEKQKSCLYLNFDRIFYEGMSYQMVVYQLKQILKTATQFDGIDSIQIAVNGSIIREIEGEGIILPDKIDDSFLATAYNY